MSDDDRIRRRAVARTADQFRQFSRNGRCGACGGCPRDANGHTYPEFCEFTDRHDHRLTGEGLVEQFNIDLREAQRRADEDAMKGGRS